MGRTSPKFASQRGRSAAGRGRCGPRPRNDSGGRSASCSWRTEQSEAAEFDPRWPLKVSVADLVDGNVKMRLDRRDEIQIRRTLFRGLHKLFKRASAFKGPSGGGFWLAPHWWFVDGMGREDADANPEDTAPPLVGPPYHRILPARARQHAHAVLRAGAIDMIFVEDGVSFRNLESAYCAS